MAYYSYQNIKTSNKQLKFLKKQTDLFLSQQQPDIQIASFSFDKNKLNLELKNPGEGSAFDIAVSCAFHITKPLFWSKGRVVIPEISEKRIPSDTIEIEGSQNLLSKIISSPKDRNILEPGFLVVFPNNEILFNSLPAKYDVMTFHCEPRFQMKTKKQLGDVPPYISKPFPFGELRTLLLENKIQEISIIFSLFGKDKLQNALNFGKICDFVVVLQDDENLETAYKQGKHGPYTFDRNEIKTRLGWEDLDSYLYGKYLGIEESDKD